MTDEGPDTPDTPAPVPAHGPGGSEEWKARGVALRAFFYIAVSHLLAGFLWLLFHVGGNADK